MSESAPSDSELLADWLKNHSEPAFRALVARYAGLVHMAAKRTSGDETLASEASQLTFILLARKARSLTSRSSLAGWLHLSAVMHSKNLLRQKRRESRKHQLLQSTMEIHQPDQHADQWKEMQPVLDDALASLSDKDRETLLLRFYRGLTVQEVATTLGIATDAAQKRITRATERLRGKLARRGCLAGVSLSAVMLAGFATDAQAALPVSALTTKALAAGSLSAFSLPTILTTIATLMKSTSVIPPFVALILAGVFIGTKYQSLTAMEQANAGLRNQIAATATPDPAVATTSRFIGRKGSVDWKGLIEELYDPYDPGGRSRALRLFEAYWDSLEPGEMASKLQEIDALGLAAGDLRALEKILMESVLEKDPGLGLSWVVAHHPDGNYLSHYDANFRRWATKDFASATEWLDREIAAGNFPNLSLGGENKARSVFERTLIRHLVEKNPAAIPRRLAAMTREQSRDLIMMETSLFSDLVTRAPTEYKKIIRENLPPGDQLEILKGDSFRLLKKGDYPEVTAYFNLVQATPEERAVCARSTARWKFSEMKPERPVIRGDIDDLRGWLGSQVPAAVDDITGEVLAIIAGPPDSGPDTPVISNKTGFGQAAALAAHYHQVSGNDVILVNFLGSRLAAEDFEQARALAGSIHDEALRAQALEKLR